MVESEGQINIAVLQLDFATIVGQCSVVRFFGLRECKLVKSIIGCWLNKDVKIARLN